MVDKSVVIDFPVNKTITYAMNETEKAFEDGGEYGTFMDWVDVLDNVCKEAYVSGQISKKQWDTILDRYPIGE